MTSKQEMQLALDLGTEIEDAVILCRKAYNRYNYNSGVSFHITYNHLGQYWFSMRTFNYDVEWNYLVKLPSVEAAREVITLGYARWWFTVKKEKQ